MGTGKEIYLTVNPGDLIWYYHMPLNLRQSTRKKIVP